MGQYRSSFDDVYTERPVTLTATAVTISADHVNKTVHANAAGAQTYTTPASTDTTIAVGDSVRIVRQADQTLTVAAGSGITIWNPGSALTARARWSEIKLTKVSATVWRLSGDVTVA